MHACWFKVSGSNDRCTLQSCQTVILSTFYPFRLLKKCKQMKTKLRCRRHAGKYRYINSDMQNVKGMCINNKIAISLCHKVYTLQRMLLFYLIYCNGSNPPPTERRFDNFHEVPILTFHGVCYRLLRCHFR